MSDEEIIFGVGCLKEKKPLHKCIVEGIRVKICTIIGIQKNKINIEEDGIIFESGRSFVARDNRINFGG